MATETLSLQKECNGNFFSILPSDLRTYFVKHYLAIELLALFQVPNSFDFLGTLTIKYTHWLVKQKRKCTVPETAVLDFNERDILVRYASRHNFGKIIDSIIRTVIPKAGIQDDTTTTVVTFIAITALNRAIVGGHLMLVKTVT